MRNQSPEPSTAQTLSNVSQMYRRISLASSLNFLIERDQHIAGRLPGRAVAAEVIEHAESGSSRY